MEREVREISRKGNHREMVAIVTEKGKRTSTTYHERLRYGIWQREGQHADVTPVVSEKEEDSDEK